jgi:hypothetical protein
MLHGFVVQIAALHEGRLAMIDLHWHMTETLPLENKIRASSRDSLYL